MNDPWHLFSDFRFWIVLLFVGLSIARAVHWRRRSKCKFCGGKTKIDEIRDPLAFNINKTVRAGLLSGWHRKKAILKCTQCGQKSSLEYRW